MGVGPRAPSGRRLGLGRGDRIVAQGHLGQASGRRLSREGSGGCSGGGLGAIFGPLGVQKWCSEKFCDDFLGNSGQEWSFEWTFPIFLKMNYNFVLF